MKVSPTKEVPRGKQDVLSGKPQRLWDYFKKLIRYLTESYEDLANAINYNDDRRRENRNDIDTLQNDSLFDSDLAANGGSIPEVDRQNDFSSMPLVNGDAIVESGSNNDGSYVRWADGTQVCWKKSFISQYDKAERTDSTWTYPASFVSSPSVFGMYELVNVGDHQAVEISNVQAYKPDTDGCRILVYRVPGQTDFSSGDEVSVHVQAVGFWK
jgi:hypothetical protein